MKRLHQKSLFSVADALFWGLTDPSIGEDEIDCFMSRESRVRLLARVNDRSAGADVDDKARFYRLCESAKLSVPETFGILSTVRTKARREPDRDSKRIALASLPNGAFVAKPVWGMKGNGILFFEKLGQDYLFESSPVNLTTFESIIEDHAATDYLVVQRRVIPHPLLANISASNSVQSVRVVTYLDEQLKVHSLFARFKFVRHGNDIDNFSDGETGNLIADVDLDSGKITKTVTKVVGEVGLRTITHHPDSGVELRATVPFWEETLGLIARGALSFRALRTLAWDVAIAPQGPVILEANQEWEIFPVAPYRKPHPIKTWNALIS